MDAILTIDSRRLLISGVSVEVDNDNIGRPINSRITVRGDLKQMDFCEKITEDSREVDKSSLSEQVANSGLSEEDRFLRKMGVVNSDNTLTPAGQAVLLQVLLDRNKEELVKVLKDITAEQK